MIFPKVEQTSAAVGRHYDELDPFYREIWGDHVHHGYWTTGKEDRFQAAEALSTFVAERLRLRPGMSACDIGCGYGETARLFASRYGISVKGVTISEKQRDFAAHKSTERVSITLCDWLLNPFEANSFDVAYAIESSEHFADKANFFFEVSRVLRPGGRFVVCAWLARSDARKWERDYLLEPICRQGRLPSMGSEQEYVSFAENSGLKAISCEDISAKVQKTWSICLARLSSKALTDPRYRQFLFAEDKKNRIFALTLALILAAYKTGSMRYCVLTFERPV